MNKEPIMTEKEEGKEKEGTMVIIEMSQFSNVNLHLV